MRKELSSGHVTGWSLPLREGQLVAWVFLSGQLLRRNKISPCSAGASILAPEGAVTESRDAAGVDSCSRLEQTRHHTGGTGRGAGGGGRWAAFALWRCTAHSWPAEDEGLLDVGDRLLESRTPAGSPCFCASRWGCPASEASGRGGQESRGPREKDYVFSAKPSGRPWLKVQGC